MRVFGASNLVSHRQEHLGLTTGPGVARGYGGEKRRYGVICVDSHLILNNSKRLGARAALPAMTQILMV